MKGKKWTYRELFLLRNNYSNKTNKELTKLLPGRSRSAIQQKAIKLGLVKERQVLERSYFKKDHRPWNTGKRINNNPNGIGWFKKGHVPHTHKPIGAESIRTNKGKQYVYVKVGDKQWKPKHKLLWEQKYGPIPKGKFLVAKDRNSLNWKPDNWEPISRQENARRNANVEKALRTKEVKALKKAYGISI